MYFSDDDTVLLQVVCRRFGQTVDSVYTTTKTIIVSAVSRFAVKMVTTIVV
jgi:hypothetical protein